MDRTPSTSLRNLRNGLAAGGVALLTGLLPLPALAQIPFLDALAPMEQADDPEDGDFVDTDDATPDPAQLLGALSQQATQLLGSAAPAAAPAPASPLTPLLAAPAMAPAIAPLLGAAAPAALGPTAAPTADPMAVLTAARGLDPSALTPFLGSVPANLGTFPETFQQQIIAVLAQAQQQSAAASHRFAPGSPALAHRHESIRERTDSRISRIAARAQRQMAAAARRAQAREARRARMAQRAVARPVAAPTASRQSPLGDLFALAGF